jgi:hypothetical protein
MNAMHRRMMEKRQQLEVAEQERERLLQLANDRCFDVTFTRDDYVLLEKDKQQGAGGKGRIVEVKHWRQHFQEQQSLMAEVSREWQESRWYKVAKQRIKEEQYPEDSLFKQQLEEESVRLEAQRLRHQEALCHQEEEMHHQKTITRTRKHHQKQLRTAPAQQRGSTQPTQHFLISPKHSLWVSRTRNP